MRRNISVLLLSVVAYATVEAKPSQVQETVLNNKSSTETKVAENARLLGFFDFITDFIDMLFGGGDDDYYYDDSPHPRYSQLATGDSLFELIFDSSGGEIVFELNSQSFANTFHDRGLKELYWQ